MSRPVPVPRIQRGWPPLGGGLSPREPRAPSSHLGAADGVLAQVHARGLAVLQAARGHLGQQVPQVLLLAPHLHGRDADREAGAGLLLPLVDELEEPGDGAGDDAQALCGVVSPDHGVGLAWGEMASECPGVAAEEAGQRHGGGRGAEGTARATVSIGDNDKRPLPGASDEMATIQTAEPGKGRD